MLTSNVGIKVDRFSYILDFGSTSFVSDSMVKWEGTLTAVSYLYEKTTVLCIEDMLLLVERFDEQLVTESCHAAGGANLERPTHQLSASDLGK